MPSKFFGIIKRSGQEQQPKASGPPPCGVVAAHTPEGDCIADIVFVHGLTGHRLDTWRSKDASDPWFQTLLPDEVPNARILTFGYDASLVGREVSQNSIRNHSRSLIISIRHLRARDHASDRPLIFVCHSLGGLVVEDAMVYAKQRPEGDLARAAFYDHVQAIMFLGTPHCGTDLHRAAVVFQNLSRLVAQTNKYLVGVLDRDSEVLANLQDEFLTIVQSLPAERRINITCFAEEIDTPGIGLVVPRSSAHLQGALFENYSIRANHRDMVRFASADDNGFSLVAGELAKWVGLVKSHRDYREHLLTQAYGKYKRFKDHGCKEFRLLEEAITVYADARRLSRALTTRDNIIVVRAEIGLTECHRELSHRYRYTAARKLMHVEDARGFVEHALMLAEQMGHRDLTWRAKLERAVIRARRAILVARTAGPGDVEAKTAVDEARAELNRLKETPETAEYNGFIEWADLWLSKLPVAL